MDRVQPTEQDEAATATNLTDANSTSKQEEETSRSVGLTGCPTSLSLTSYFSALALQPVNAAWESCDEESREEAEEQVQRGEAGTERLELASNCIVNLSICPRAARRQDGGKKQQLRPAKRLCKLETVRDWASLQQRPPSGFKLPKTYFCGYCNKSFHSVTPYCRHLRRHVNLWRCDKCNEGFELLALKKHHRKFCMKFTRHRNQRKLLS